MNKNLFNSVQMTKPKKNRFDLTHDVKLTTEFGRLTPVMAMECVPGDKISVGGEVLVRFAPMLAPVMHQFNVFIHYFFVPNRILWPNWEEFIGDPTGAHVHPFVAPLLGSNSSLGDYLGLPVTDMPVGAEANAFPFAAYQRIWHEYYRDQNLIPADIYQLTDGANTAGESYLNTLRTRAWEHDYFTAALPFAQKGAQVEIPLGDVTLKATTDPDGTNQGLIRDNTSHALYGAGALNTDAGGGLLAGSTGTAVYDPNGTLTVGSTTINDLRRAYSLQRWLEKNARGGTRYTELLKAHFGVFSSDKRLQRPEYVCGLKTPVVISEVLNSAGATAADGPVQGNMSGHGVTVSRGKSGGFFCEEHGWMMGILSIMPKSAYQNGVPKKFIKEDFLSYYWKDFAQLGEQEVLNAEVYAASTDPGGTFGYVPRYSEYKFEQNRVAGSFKDTLDFWQFGRIFTGDTPLNQSFVECVTDNRIFAVTEDGVDHIYIDCMNHVQATRPMPVFGTPGW